MRSRYNEKLARSLIIAIMLVAISVSLAWAEQPSVAALEAEVRQRTQTLGEKDPKTLDGMNDLAIAYYRLGRLSEAAALGEKTLTLRQEVLTEKHPDILVSMNNLAVYYELLGRLKEAVVLSEKALALKREKFSEKNRSTLASMSNLAAQYYMLGRFKEAAALDEKTLALRQEVLTENDPETLGSMNNLANDYCALGRVEEAAALKEKTLAMMRKSSTDKDSNTLSSMSSLAAIYRKLGRLVEAVALDEKTLVLRQEVLPEKHPNILASMSNLATDYYGLGRFKEAVALNEKTLTLRQEVLPDKHPDVLTSMNNLALCYRAVGQFEAAAELDEKTLKLRKESLPNKHPDVLTSMNNLAGDFYSLGRFKEAAELDKDAQVLMREGLPENDSATLISMLNLAVDYSKLGRINESIVINEKTLALMREVLGEKNPSTLVGMRHLAMNYEKQNDYQKALPLFRNFINGVETLRNDFVGLYEDTKQFWFAQFVPTYKTAIFFYCRQGLAQEAFTTTELSKARSLLDKYSARLADESGILDAAEKAKIREWQKQLADYDDRIGTAINAQQQNKRIRLETERNDINRAYQIYRQSLMEKYPKYGYLCDAAIVTAEQGRQLLPDGTAFISYVQKNNCIVAFVLDFNQGLKIMDLGEVPELAETAMNYHRLLSYPSVKAMHDDNLYLWRLSNDLYKFTESRIRPSELAVAISDDQELSRCQQAMANYLGSKLLQPLAKHLEGNTKWIISPDGALTIIPFETLTYKAQPAVVSADISYIQSLSMLALLTQRQEQNAKLKDRKELLAMGAAVYEGNSIYEERRGLKSIVETADKILTRGAISMNILRQPINLTDIHWPNLPTSEEEIQNVVGLFPVEKASTYLIEDASESKLKELNQSGELAQYRYILFSTHGINIPQAPLLNAVVLGQVNNPPGTDGYITFGEWPAYNLASDLVFMSACETGLGKAIEGEGVVGLPFALYVAGNKNTVMTLWKIDDRGSTKFSTAFFEKLRNGWDQVTALNQTKREFLARQDVYRNPMYWSPFLLYGI